MLLDVLAKAEDVWGPAGSWGSGEGGELESCRRGRKQMGQAIMQTTVPWWAESGLPASGSRLITTSLGVLETAGGTGLGTRVAENWLDTRAAMSRLAGRDVSVTTWAEIEGMGLGV